MEKIKGKKILILGGTYQQMKFVNAAKELGLYTIVSDYLPDSPAKKISDKPYDINITDIDALVEMCKDEHVEGIISGYIDPCQRPYQELCERLGLPCYGTKEQFFSMTDKHAFKEMCKRNGVDIIPEFTEDDIKNKTVEFPVFVKPTDSRGSRGQAVCYNYNELKSAIVNAKVESSNGDILIEKYMGDAHEVQITYFYINGNPYLIRTVDSYTGSEKNHLEKVVACAVSPSRYTDDYLANAHPNVIKMFSSLGFKNGPIFMQGFEDNGKFRFFDPGLRFPGVDYELIYKNVYGIDIAKILVEFAITGQMPDVSLPEDGAYINGKRAGVIFPTVKAGIVGDISCLDDIKTREYVVSCLPRVTVGEKLEWTYNVNQRLAEIDILGDNTDDLRRKIEDIQNGLTVVDANGKDMIFEWFDPYRIS